MAFTVKQSIFMCDAIYSTQLKPDLVIQGITVENVWNNDNYGNDFAICSTKDDIMVLVKGTDFNEMSDILTNIKIKKHKITLNSGENIKVHLGYHEAATEIIKLLKNDLDKLLKDSIRPIHITGHSLGGAVASLIALYLKDQEYDNVNCRTFAAPACGNKSFRSIMEQKFPTFERYVYITDYVPFLIFFFEHPAPSIVINENGDTKVYKRNTWTTLISIIIMFLSGSKKRQTAIQAHYPRTYVNVINKMK